MTKFTDRQMPPLPPSEPLDEEERALARALRGLPSTMPPPELDARILGASRRAIAIAPKPRAHRHGWVWGLSTAAAAVLATGVLLKMHKQGRDQSVSAPSEAPVAGQTATGGPAAMPAGTNAPLNAKKSATETSADMEAAQSATAGSNSKEAQARASSAVVTNAIVPPPEAAKSERDEMKAAKAAAPSASATGTVMQLDKSAAGQAAQNAAPQPFPAAPAEAPRAVPAAPPEREAAGGFAKPTTTDQPSNVVAPSPPPVMTAISQPRPAPVAAAPEPAQQQAEQEASEARKDSALSHVEVTGSRLKAADSKQLPAVDDDATLTPTQWLGRVRARVDAGDSVGARESLRRYAARYPDAWIPPDLAPLRK